MFDPSGARELTVLSNEIELALCHSWFSMRSLAQSSPHRNTFPPWSPRTAEKIARLKAAALAEIAESDREERENMATATRQREKQKPDARVKRPHLNVVPASPRTFKTQEEIDQALRQSLTKIATFNVEKQVFETHGVCHGSKSDNALIFDPVANEVSCKEGCESRSILRAFKLPEQPQTDTADFIHDLRERTGVPFKEIIKLGATESNYDAVLDDGIRLSLGKAIDVYSFTKTRAKIADACGIGLSAKTVGKEWELIASLIFRSAKIVVTYSESDTIRTLIEGFVNRSQLRGGYQTNGVDAMTHINSGDKGALFQVLTDIKKAANDNDNNKSKGFFDIADQRVYLYIETLKRFANFNEHFAPHKVSATELAEMLARQGFKSKQMAARQSIAAPQCGGEVISVRLWYSPPNYLKQPQKRSKGAENQD